MNTPDKIFSHARWIWPESHNWDIHNSYALFRKEFTLAQIPAKAPLFITADQSYRLYLNGRYVCGGPARGFQKNWPYDEVDVSAWLRKGKNTIAVRAHNPGCSNFQYRTEGFAGLLVAARWGKFELVSDKSWKSRRQTGVNPGAVPTSLQLFHQEHNDLRIEDPAWMQPGFNDSAWNEHLVDSIWSTMPWYSLEARGIPLLREEVILPRSVLGVRQGKSAKDYASCRDVSRTFFADGLTHLKASLNPKELKVGSTGSGRYHRFLIDFETTVVGSLGLEIQGASGGEIIDTLHVETIDPKTLAPHYQPDRHSRMAFSHRLICRKGDQAHVFHHPFGFRYMLLAVRDSKSTLRIRPFLRTALYPLEIKGTFSCSEPSINEIWNVCRRTEQVCSMDAFVDTPWREQAQWWGDARVQAWNTFHLSGDSRLFRRGIKQIAGQHVPNGLTYGHAPTMAHGCILPDFSLIWILTLWDYYWQTGSLEPLQAHEKTVHGILDFFAKSTGPKSGLATFDPRYWLFLDWTKIQNTGTPTVLNLWLLIVLERLVELYGILGNKTRGAALRRQASNLRCALAVMVDAKGLVHDGIDEKGCVSRKTSVHSQTLALTAGLKGISEKRMLEQILLPWIREQKTFEAMPSSYWSTYVFTVLQERGYGNDVLQFIRKNWTPMVAHGTTWENFHPRPGDESFSHAWSAHPLYHFEQILGGITQASPAWKTIRFEPQFLVDSCEITIPSPAGLIRSAWKKTSGSIEGKLTLPAGVKAEVCLPGKKSQTVDQTTQWHVTLEPKLDPI